jgi:hypothetical protein
MSNTFNFHSRMASLMKNAGIDTGRIIAARPTHETGNPTKNHQPFKVTGYGILR